MHSKTRRAKATRWKTAKGELVAVDRDVLREGMQQRGVSINALAKAVSDALGEQVTDPTESLRKRIASVLGGRQARMRRKELRAVARILRIALPGLIDSEARGARLPAEVEAERIRRWVSSATGGQLDASFEAPLEQILSFDSWNLAFGAPSEDMPVRQLSSLQARFAKHVADAILCLFESFEKDSRQLKIEQWLELIGPVLELREARIEEAVKPKLFDHSEESVLDIAQRNRRRFRKNQEEAWEEPGAVAPATAEGVLPVSRGGSGVSKRPKKSRPSRRR